jgi:hypothetical protein
VAPWAGLMWVNAPGAATIVVKLRNAVALAAA